LKGETVKERPSAREYAKRAEDILDSTRRDNTTHEEMEHRALVIALLSVTAAIEELRAAVVDLRNV
jgi:hypothetical protein